MESSIKEKVILITGGSSGLGKEVARTLSNLGAFVYITYLNSEKEALRIKNELTKNDRFLEVFKADVTCRNDVERLAEYIKSRHGVLDVLINNAGIDNPDLVKDYSQEVWKRIIEVNLFGKFNCTKLFLPLLLKSSAANVINISSRYGNKPLHGASAYCCSQAAIQMLTKVSAIELSEYKIRVNAIIPGFIRTPMNEKIFKEEPNIWEEAAKANPLLRIGDPSDVSKLVLFLTSTYAEYITGECVNVNGGITLV